MEKILLEKIHETSNLSPKSPIIQKAFDDVLERIKVLLAKKG